MEIHIILSDGIIIQSGMFKESKLSIIQEDEKGNIDILQSLDTHCSDASRSPLKQDSIRSLEIKVTNDKVGLLLNGDFIQHFKNLKVLRIDNQFVHEVTGGKCKHIISKDIKIPILFAGYIDTLDILGECGNINISGQSYSDGHLINRTIIKNLTIGSDKKNIKSIRLNNLEIIESFYINHCHLEKLFVMNVLLGNTNYIHDTTLDSCFVYGTELIKLNSFNNLGKGLYNLEITNKNDIGKTQELKNTEGEIKEYYRQLKFAHDEIGNKTEANKFFAKEMEYHMKELKESGNAKDYWIAKLQKEISDFGNDWVRALSWYFIFTLLCYWFYSGFDFISHEWINIWSNERFMIELSRLTKILNPLPKVEDITNPLLLLFSLIKILIVYQIVVALRRISQR